MSQNPSKDSTKSIVKFDGTGTWNAYEDNVKAVFLTESHNAHDSLISGAHPLFLAPALDVMKAVARRLIVPAQSAAMQTPVATTAATPAAPVPVQQPPDLPDDIPTHWFVIPENPLTLPLWSSVVDTTAGVVYKDAKYYYTNPRGTGFFGAQGQEIWKNKVSCVIRAEYNYNTYEMKKAWSMLFSSIAQQYQDKIVVLPDYAAKHAAIDYIWLWATIKFVITGEGPQSLSLLMIKLVNMKMRDDNFDKYCRDHVDVTNDLYSRKIPGEVMFKTLIDALFHIGLYGESNTILKPQLQIIFGSSAWPTANESIATFSKYLTTLSKLDDTYSGIGVIKANIAKTSTSKKPAGSKTPASGSSTTICWNCARPGHTCMNCKAPVSTCATCSGNHHTSVHDKVVAAEERKASRQASKKSGNPPSFQDSYKRVTANMASEAEYDATDDDDQLDATMTLSAHQAALEEAETEQPLDDPDEDDIEGSIFGFTARITHITTEDDDSDMPSLVYSISTTSSTSFTARITHTTNEENGDSDMPSLATESEVDPDDDWTDASEYDYPSLDSYIAVTDRFDYGWTDVLGDDELTPTTLSTDEIPAAMNVIHLDMHAWNVATNIQAQSTMHVNPSDVIAYLDSAAGGHIFLPEHKTDLMFTHVTPSKGIVIEGVDEEADPIPVTMTAKHHILGHVNIAQIRNCLISIPKLLKKDFTMVGKKNNIVINDKDGNEVFNSTPDEKGLYPVNLTRIYQKSRST